MTEQEQRLQEILKTLSSLEVRMELLLDMLETAKKVRESMEDDIEYTKDGLRGSLEER